MKSMDSQNKFEIMADLKKNRLLVESLLFSFQKPKDKMVTKENDKRKDFSNETKQVAL
jgi:hypothetical protein